MAVITIAFRPADHTAKSRAALHTRLWERLKLAAAARRTRRLLSTMDARMLSDIGVSRADALQEAARPVWDAGLR